MIDIELEKSVQLRMEDSCAPSASSVWGNISASIQRTPAAVAVIDSAKNWSFAELGDQVERFTASLNRHGVGAGDIVGICLESRVEAVWTLIAVLRLGAVFVPIDPLHPKEKRDRILRDASPSVVVVSNKTCTLFDSVGSITVEELGRAAFSGLPSVDVWPDNPACILYTSGSTGHPKGVERVHRGILSRLAWSASGRDDVFCHSMPLCYGFSQERIFLPLMQGLPLAMLSDECHNDAAALARAVALHGVTQLTVVPAVLEQLVDPVRNLSSYLSAIRRITVGSASIPPGVIDQFHQVLPHVRLVGVYGITEAGTLTIGEMTAGAQVNAGVPAPEVKVYILDENLKPVAPGDEGEVCGGGPSLARGYWRQPELTARRFVPNPFCDAGVPILYRTGDRGRQLPDGQIQLLGRADRQVKVRGYRIELDEVESALLTLTELGDAAVISQSVGHDNRLIAYVCARHGQSISVSKLRRHLRDHVPDYMLPSAYVVLPEMPRTPIGKLDSATLPSPGTSRPELENPYVVPETPLENAVADIWAEVLDKECVGRHDHFIDLGGDSIMAVQVVAAIEKQLGIALTVASVFELPTVAEMAMALSASQIQ